MRWERRVLLAAVVLMLCAYVARAFTEILGINNIAWAGVIAVLIGVAWVVLGIMSTMAKSDGNTGKFYKLKAAQILPFIIVIGIHVGSFGYGDEKQHWTGWFSEPANYLTIVGTFLPIILISLVYAFLADGKKTVAKAKEKEGEALVKDLELDKPVEKTPAKPETVDEDDDEA